MMLKKLDIKAMLIKLKLLSKNKVMKNGMWLFGLQMFNTVLPLLTLPYITRVLGASNYGVFSSALNWIGYLQAVALYGFDLYGAKKVALAKDNIQISKIMSIITFCKLVLCVACFGLLLCLSLISHLPKLQLICTLILFTMVLGDAIRQTWLFQGMQIMHHITIISMIARIVSVILIFTFVKNSDQLFLYCLIYATTFLLIGLISMIVTRVILKIHFCKVSLYDLWEYLNEAWYLFISSIMTRLFTGIGITVLTFTGSSLDVGVYSAVQKIPYILSLIYAPVGQAIYPYISQQYSANFKIGKKKINRISRYIILTFSIVGIILIIFAKPVLNILYGDEFENYAYLVMPLVCWLIVGIINNLLGIQVLVASGHQKEYHQAFLIGSISIVLCNVIFGFFWNFRGIAYAVLVSEIILLIANFIQIRKVEKLKMAG